MWGAVSLRFERQTVNQRPGFESTCSCFETLVVSFTPTCLCLLDETLKVVGPFYLVSMSEEVKDPTQGVNV